MSDADRRQAAAEAGESDRLRTARLIEALDAWADRICVEELARAERRLRGLTGTECEIVEAVGRHLVAALLRGPRERLCSASGAERARYAAEIAHLFRLDLESRPDDGEDERPGIRSRGSG